MSSIYKRNHGDRMRRGGSSAARLRAVRDDDTRESLDEFCRDHRDQREPQEERARKALAAIGASSAGNKDALSLIRNELEAVKGAISALTRYVVLREQQHSEAKSHVVNKRAYEWKDGLLKGYSVDVESTQQIMDFVDEHELEGLLVDAAERIRASFGGCDLRLDLAEDDLMVVIITKLEVDKAVALLRKLEHDWWVDARGERLCVSLTLEFC